MNHTKYDYNLSYTGVKNIKLFMTCAFLSNQMCESNTFLSINLKYFVIPLNFFLFHLIIMAYMYFLFLIRTGVWIKTPKSKYTALEWQIKCILLLEWCVYLHVLAYRCMLELSLFLTDLYIHIYVLFNTKGLFF